MVKMCKDKVRREWLISLLVYCGTTAITLVFTFLIFDFSLGIGLASALVCAAVQFWIPYHCAYKKQGTAWLMFTMVSMTIRGWIGLSKVEWVDWLLVDWLVISIVLGIQVYYWVNCLRLWKVNTARRGLKPIQSESCQEAVEDMRNAPCLESLDAKLYYAISQWPQWEGQLKNEYEIIQIEYASII